MTAEYFATVTSPAVIDRRVFRNCDIAGGHRPPLQFDYVIMSRRHVQAFDVRRAPGEDCSLIDVTFVRNFAGIDRRRFLEKKSTPGKARGSAAIGLKPGEAFTHARANPFIRNKCRNR